MAARDQGGARPRWHTPTRTRGDRDERRGETPVPPRLTNPWNDGGTGELGRTGGEASGAGNFLRYDDRRITECTRRTGKLDLRQGRDGQFKKWVGIQSRARGGATSGSPVLSAGESWVTNRPAPRRLNLCLNPAASRSRATLPRYLRRPQGSLCGLGGYILNSKEL